MEVVLTKDNHLQQEPVRNGDVWHLYFESE